MSNIISHDSEKPANGLQVFTACAFIHKTVDGTEKVFLPKRSEKKKFLPIKYELPGGHIEFGESLVQGLKREIKEEFQMELNAGDPFHVFSYMNEIKGSHSIEVIYFATFQGDVENITLNPDDHSAFIWASENEYKDLMSNVNIKGDDEYGTILKGFDLLKGSSLSFG